MSRVSRNQMYMEMARLVARRSTCSRAQVGAILVSEEGRMYGYGYNGSAPGAVHCSEEGCYIIGGRCWRTVHAEINAILNCVKQGIKINPGSILYCTHSPCMSCANALAGILVKKIYYEKLYDEKVLDYLKKMNIEVIHI